MKTAVVSYGVGNIRSVVNALSRVGANPVRVEDGAELLEFEPSRIVCPGVGAVAEVLFRLRERGFDGALNQLVLDRGIPFLGICVGMQILFERCFEFGNHEGLGWFQGSVEKLPESKQIRLPHVGWNPIRICHDDALFRDLTDPHMYFLHSYAASCPESLVIAKAEYGCVFPAAVRRETISAVQFHPEKSSGAGHCVLASFIGPKPC